MKILYLDTCNSPLYVAVFDNGSIGSMRIKTNTEASRRYNSLLLPMIDELLSETDLSAKDIDAVACVAGAGSFTGIRLGIATAHAFARAVNAKLLSVNEFEIMAWNSTGSTIAAIDAGHENYYIGEFLDGVCIRLGNATLTELQNYKGQVIYFDNEIDSEAVFGVICDKINKDLYVPVLAPLYLKASQAEREADKKADKNV